MVLQTSGQITLLDVQSEFGGSAPININEYYRGGTYVPDTAANSGIPTSGQIRLSDFYGGDSTPAGPITEDPYYELTQLRQLSGQSASWSTYTDSLSSYAGQKGRLVFVYQNGSSFRGDIQIDDINFDGNSYSFESNSQDWLTSTSTTNTTDFNNLGKFQSNISNLSTIPTGTGGFRWNRDSGGTPSSSTGLTTADAGSYYIYTEVSGTGSGSYFTACSPLLQLSSSPGNLSYAVARYGSNIGTLRTYWAENVTTDPYPGSAGFSNCVLISRTRLNGSASSNSFFWPGGGSTTTPQYAFGTYPSGPSNGASCKIAISYVSGNNFTSDFQLDDAAYNATSEGNFNASNGGTDANIESTTSGVAWQQSITRRTFTSTTMPSASDIRSYVNSETFVDLFVSTSAGQWNIDGGGTPSSSTGLTSLPDGGNYCYWEATTSGTGYSYKHRTLLSPSFTINTSSGRGFAVQMGVYGAAMGRMQVFLLY